MKRLPGMNTCHTGPTCGRRSRMLAKAILHEAVDAGNRRSRSRLRTGSAGHRRTVDGTVGDVQRLRCLTALRFAADNAKLNGFRNFARCNSTGVRRRTICVQVILASDLVYEIRNAAPIVAFIKRVLLPGGVCLLTDQDRVPSHALKEMLQSEGLAFTTKLMRRRTGRPPPQGDAVSHHQGSRAMESSGSR